MCSPASIVLQKASCFMASTDGPQIWQMHSQDAPEVVSRNVYAEDLRNFQWVHQPNLCKAVLSIRYL